MCVCVCVCVCEEYPNCASKSPFYMYIVYAYFAVPFCYCGVLQHAVLILVCECSNAYYSNEIVNEIDTSCIIMIIKCAALTKALFYTVLVKGLCSELSSLGLTNNQLQAEIDMFISDT